MRFLLLVAPGETNDLVSDFERGVGANFDYCAGCPIAEDLGVVDEESAVVLVEVDGCGCGPFNAHTYLAFPRRDSGYLSGFECGSRGDGHYCCVGCHFKRG